MNPLPTKQAGRARILESAKKLFAEQGLEGASLRAMAFGPVHMEQTAAPGERGNVVLAGHRNNWFLPLRDIAVGHRLELEWPGAAAGTVARAAGLVAPGYRLLANTGLDAHQEVPHLHVHIFAGRPLGPMLASRP